MLYVCSMPKGRVFPLVRWPGTHSDAKSKKTTREQRVSLVVKSGLALADLAVGWLGPGKVWVFSRRPGFGGCRLVQSEEKR